MSIPFEFDLPYLFWLYNQQSLDPFLISFKTQKWALQNCQHTFTVTFVIIRYCQIGLCYGFCYVHICKPKFVGTVLQCSFKTHSCKELSLSQTKWEQKNHTLNGTSPQSKTSRQTENHKHKPGLVKTVWVAAGCKCLFVYLTGWLLWACCTMWLRYFC